MPGFFKKYNSVIISVIIILLIFTFTGIICMSCTENSKIMQGQPLIAEANNIGNLAVYGKDNGKANKDDPIESNSMDSQDMATEEDTVEENSDMENPTEEITGEDGAEEQEQQEQGQTDSEEIKEENDDSDQSGTQDIDYGNSDNFSIEVDLSQQKVFIFYKSNLLKEWACSGGTEEKPTPTGEFKTSDKGTYFWSADYNMGAYYWVRFYNEYLFHSVPFDIDNQMIEEEYAKLGTPASHGCIRLELENAKWLYEMLPSGVKVLIY